MNRSTRTDPGSHTRPRSFRARSTSIVCSARSFSLSSELGGQGVVLRGRRAAGARPGDRAQLAGAVEVEPDVRLGRRADQLVALHVEQEHVRRRVDGPERPVDRRRRGAGRAAHALGGDDLVGVSRRDVLLGPFDRRHVAGLGHLRLGRARRDWLGHRHAQRAAERLDRPVDGETLAGYRHRAADMVERDHRLGEQEPHRGQAGVGAVRGGQRHRLELRHPVVAQEPDRAPGERRRPGGRPGLGGGEGGRLLERPDGREAGRQERVAAHLLASLDRLEQERRRAERLAQAQVGADRRDQVGGKLAGVAFGCHAMKKAPRPWGGEACAKRGCRGVASGPHLARVATTTVRRSFARA